MEDIDGMQHGWGRRGYAGISHVYIGTPNQRGHGIGSFLGGLFRRVLPLIKKGAKAVGKEALRTGVNVAGDVLERNITLKDAVRERVRESGGKLKRKAEEKIDTLMRGSGYKTRKISRTAHSLIERKPRRISGKKKSVTKRRVIKKKKKTTSKRKTKKKKTRQRTVADIFG